MTFKRFSEIWRSVKWPKVRKPLLVDHGMPRVNAALRRASDGDFREFDEIDRRLAEHDRRPACIPECGDKACDDCPI